VQPHLSTTAPDYRQPVAIAVSNIGHSLQKRLQPLDTAKLHCMHITTEFSTNDYPLPNSWHKILMCTFWEINDHWTAIHE